MIASAAVRNKVAAMIPMLAAARETFLCNIARRKRWQRLKRLKFFILVLGLPCCDEVARATWSVEVEVLLIIEVSDIDLHEEGARRLWQGTCSAPRTHSDGATGGPSRRRRQVHSILRQGRLRRCPQTAPASAFSGAAAPAIAPRLVEPCLLWLLLLWLLLPPMIARRLKLILVAMLLLCPQLLLLLLSWLMAHLLLLLHRHLMLRRRRVVLLLVHRRLLSLLLLLLLLETPLLHLLLLLLMLRR
mmetsp:Transcript_99580/g.287445  ORF Transcript_99580/g.287445 Transcript_99580/m.287445 type:complete len:245 (-) Transcript_99580:374-1108(-)